jgi:Ala-tRNA(Pro) deacylase
MVSRRLREYLDRHHVHYVVMRHPVRYTAQEIAESSHTKGRSFAKSVMLQADDEFVLAVLPAPCTIDLEHTRDVLGVQQLTLASEDDIHDVFFDCEVGAMPPFGLMYGVSTLLDHLLTYCHELTFNAGTHRELIRMRTRDYIRIVKPQTLKLSFGLDDYESSLDDEQFLNRPRIWMWPKSMPHERRH